MVLVSCAPQMTDVELEAELAKLTPEEREELVKDLESQEKSGFVGQAIAKKVYSTKISPKVLKVSPALVKQAVSKLPSSLPSGEAPAEKPSTVPLPSSSALDECYPPCPAGSFCANLEKSCIQGSGSECYETDEGGNIYLRGATYGLGTAQHDSSPGDYSFFDPATGLQTEWPAYGEEEKSVLYRGIDVCYLGSGNQPDYHAEFVSSCSGKKCYLKEFACHGDKIVNVICPNGCSNGACLSEAVVLQTE